MLEGIAVAIVSGIVAGLGGWLGARQGLARYRSERVFDRQIQWYQDVTRALTRIDTVLTDALTMARANDTTGLAALNTRANDMRENLGVVLNEVALYGTAAARAAVDEYRRDLTRLNQKVQAAKLLSEQVEFLEESRRLILRCYDKLSTDHRVLAEGGVAVKVRD